MLQKWGGGFDYFTQLRNNVLKERVVSIKKELIDN